jgi:hypothetical protein
MLDKEMMKNFENEKLLQGVGKKKTQKNKKTKK